MNREARPAWAWILLLVVLAVLPYCRALFYPFISDDYFQIQLGRQWGTLSTWRDLLSDPLYRCRATSIYLTAWTERAFGLWPVAYHASSVALHAVNVLLVLLLARGLQFTGAVPWLAAAFYAVYEGHQEAVIWYSALPEQLVLTFSLGSLLVWTRWAAAGRWSWLAASLALFVLALFSKESAVAVVPLMLLVALRRRDRPWPQILAAAVPFAALAVVYTALIFLSRGQHGHFHDGTFALTPAVLHVLPRSIGRLLFFWGLLAALVLGWRRELAFSLGWMAVVLLPYSFLTYMVRVPSRHTYFAAVGLAFLVGAGFARAVERWGGARRSWLALALGAVIVLHNCVYLWTYKHDQFLERAAPTERLLEELASVEQDRQVWLVNFPYNALVPYWALAVATTRPPDSVVVSSNPPPPDAAVLEWDKERRQYKRR